ncbi:MAG: cytochrome c [Planctomycetes bacterium]|uniref:c-type cytochrome n=1 Tax=Candidatus Wunengus californicus TaxID=3367619 RepID=UPI00402A2F09|nr:cytochrome c [Planctomycetota bacterium]MBI4221994.1 cytochrome c [Planctomycetota bacterium]
MFKTGIFAVTSAAVVAGMVTFFSGAHITRADIDARKLYATHCETCHDAYGKPTDIGAALESADFSDTAWQAKTTDEQIVKQITDGTPEKMTPFKETLTLDEIKALVPVVRSFEKK